MSANANPTYQLCIDQGNSNTKIAVFEADHLMEYKAFKDFTVPVIRDILQRFPVDTCIISSVADLNAEIIHFLEQKIGYVIVLDDKTLIPFENRYSTPATLGKDRIAAIAGAIYLKPGADLLVIDAGTAITYDFVDSKGIFHGGNIAPGLEMRLRALNEYTSKLPLVEAEADVPFLGTDTKTAILSGVVNGIVFEINGYFDRLKFKYPELSIYLTGGSTFYFYSKLKNPIFAEKYLVLIGLNRILLFNVQK